MKGCHSHGLIYTLMQDCRKTSALSEVLRRSLLRHELSAVTFESKRKRVQIGYI